MKEKERINEGRSEGERSFPTFVVEEVEGEADLGAVEPRVLLGQSPLPLHVEHEVAAAHELDHEEEPRRRLKATFNCKIQG